jgi:hypothetical protein
MVGAFDRYGACLLCGSTKLVLNINSYPRDSAISADHIESIGGKAMFQKQ